MLRNLLRNRFRKFLRNLLQNFLKICSEICSEICSDICSDICYGVLWGAPGCSRVLRGAPGCSQVLRGDPGSSGVLWSSPGCSRGSAFGAAPETLYLFWYLLIHVWWPDKNCFPPRQSTAYKCVSRRPKIGLYTLSFIPKCFYNSPIANLWSIINKEDQMHKT